jgi:hypothetical protein
MTDLPQRLKNLADALERRGFTAGVQDCLRAAEVIERLPVMKDRVRWYPGMELWPPMEHLRTTSDEPVELFTPSREVSINAIDEDVTINAVFQCEPSRDGYADYGSHEYSVSDCYSTEEAAQAVKEKSHE